MAIWRKCLEHSVVFPVNLFWSNLHPMFLLLCFSWNSHVWSFFSSILGIETFFSEGLKAFYVVLVKDKLSHIKNRKAWWQEHVFLIYCFNFFRNQLWQHLISYNSFRNIFFQSKKFTACKIKDEKEETIFYFLMVFNLLKIIYPFESKKHLRI